MDNSGTRKSAAALILAAFAAFSPYAGAQQTSPAPPSTQQGAPPGQPSTQQGPPPAQQGATPQDPHIDQERSAQRRGLGFLQYLDQGRFADSYAYTSNLLRKKVDQEQFVKDLEKARKGKGAVQSRHLLDATYDLSLPDVPKGQYVVLQYQTDFLNQKSAVETLTMAFERNYWRVAGYFIK